jgi:hypothetical protein
MLIALHSALRNSSAIHASTCPQVAGKRPGLIRQKLQATTPADAMREVAEDAPDGRKITVCACAKGA